MSPVKCAVCGYFPIAPDSPNCPKCNHLMALEQTAATGAPAVALAETTLCTFLPSRNATFIAVVPAVMFMGVAGVAVSAIGLNTSSDTGTLLAILGLVVLGGLLFAGRAFWGVTAKRREHYVLSNQRLRTTGSSKLWEIDIRHIKNVQNSASWLEARYRAGHVWIFSANRETPYQMFSVEDPEAVREKIRDAVFHATGKRPELGE